MNAATPTNRTTSEQRRNPAGGRGRWKENIADTVTPLPCRLQVERGARCPSCEYLRIVRYPKFTKGICTFLGETLFRRGGHE